MHNADIHQKNDVLGMQTCYHCAMGSLVGQLYEYSHLEFSLTNLFASAFYVLTGYGLHV